jgi:hypothetical protein
MTDTKATLTLQGIPIVDAFLTGSCLVRSVTPQDIDICILFGCKADMTSFRKGKEECLPAEERSLGDGPEWESLRDGKINYIVTTDVEFFYRMKAFSGALALLQIESKDDRKKLCQSCRNWESHVVTDRFIEVSKETYEP